MTDVEFLSLMHFPTEWKKWGMYPPDLFRWQLGGYIPGHEAGAEHDRNGAFHWWLKRSLTRTQLQKLLRLAALDPDPALGSDIRRYIQDSHLFDDEVAALDRQLFGA